MIVNSPTLNAEVHNNISPPLTYIVERTPKGFLATLIKAHTLFYENVLLRHNEGELLS
jgi:hypothetical protein